MDPLFVGRQIYLRGLEHEDLVLRPKWFNDPEINRTLLMDFPISKASTEEWFRRASQKTNVLNLSICDKQTDSVIGMAGLLQIDQTHRHAQFYMTIGEKSFWGRRIPDEVIPIVLRYAFTYRNLQKVYLWTIPSNDRARHVYERNGFIKEAHMRSHYFCNGASQDLIQHSILIDEWAKGNEIAGTITNSGAPAE